MSEFFENEAQEASSSDEGDESDGEHVRSRPVKDKKKKTKTKKVASSDDEDDGESACVCVCAGECIILERSQSRPHWLLLIYSFQFRSAFRSSASPSLTVLPSRTTLWF